MQIPIMTGWELANPMRDFYDVQQIKLSGVWIR